MVFISHRFSTVRRADRILVLRDGQLTEKGTHEQLVAKNGYHSKMFKLQAEAYESRPTSTEEARMDPGTRRIGELGF